MLDIAITKLLRKHYLTAFGHGHSHTGDVLPEHDIFYETNIFAGNCQTNHSLLVTILADWVDIAGDVVVMQGG